MDKWGREASAGGWWGFMPRETAIRCIVFPPMSTKSWSQKPGGHRASWTRNAFRRHFSTGDTRRCICPTMTSDFGVMVGRYVVILAKSSDCDMSTLVFTDKLDKPCLAKRIPKRVVRLFLKPWTI